MKSLSMLLVVVINGLSINSVSAQSFTAVSHLLNPSSNSAVTWGSSAADMNSDGWVDIYQGNGFDPGKLYLNRGGQELVDILPATGVVDNADFCWGGVFGDYNRDGFLDLALIGANRLYRNIGNQTFINQTTPSAITFPSASQGPAWLDFDGDGRLDIFINDDFGNNQLLRNLNNSNFSDITEAAGVRTVGGSYGVAASDFNNDGHADVFIATCSSSPENSIKHLLRNNGDNTFTDINVSAGVGDSLASWGVVWLDYDNDGWLDLYIGNMPLGMDGRNKLYRNNGDETFTDVAPESGVAGELREPTFGVATADFDNDGWMDIYAGNRSPQPGGFTHRLYRNNGDGTFVDVAASAGITAFQEPTVSLADFNNDGWIDIFIPGAPQNQLLFNDGGSNHWLKIRLRGKASNLFGVGARIEVVAGGLRQIREVNAGDGFVSQSRDLAAHFGLGGFAQADSIIVKWPGRGTDRLANITADREITIVEGLGLNNRPTAPQLQSPADGVLLQNSNIAFRWLSASDPELDPLTYDLRVSSPTFFVLLDDLQDTTFNLTFSHPQREIFSWNVTATDGHSIVSSTELFSFDNVNIVSVSENGGLPGEFSLSQNYPNPFNPNTVIRLSLASATHAALKIYDIRGREIRTLLDGFQQAGERSLVWDGRDANGNPVVSGIYVSRLQAGGSVATKKMILLR